MIDKKMENIYNIILSIFCGIIISIIFNSLFSKPITTTYYKKN